MIDNYNDRIRELFKEYPLKPNYGVRFYLNKEDGIYIWFSDLALNDFKFGISSDYIYPNLNIKNNPIYTSDKFTTFEELFDNLIIFKELLIDKYINYIKDKQNAKA